MAKMSHIFDENDDPNMDSLYRKYIILPELGKRLMSADLNHEKDLNNEKEAKNECNNNRTDRR